MTAHGPEISVRYKIGDIILETGPRKVSRDGEILEMGGLTYDFLSSLVHSAPNVVENDELADKIWSGRTVSPETITRRAAMLRQALSDDAESPRYFEVVRGRGYRMVADVTQLTGPAEIPRKRLTLLAASCAALSLIVVGIVGWFIFANERMETVAVLPFEDMSPNADQQYLARGIAAEIINELAGFDGLRVVGQVSSFSYGESNKSLRAIGEELGADSILVGSVRKDGNSLRVTAQLLDSNSEYHIWSQEFDRNLTDIFAIQEEIARTVSGALGVQLGVGSQNQFKGAGTSNVEAYELYLEALSDRNPQRAIPLLERVVELDPDYAAAWAMLAVSVGGRGWDALPEAALPMVTDAYEFVGRAIEADPESARGLSIFGTYSSGLALNWGRGEDSHVAALKIRPRDYFVLVQYGNTLSRAGRIRAARAQHELAQSVEPLAPLSSLRHNIMIAQRRFDEAENYADRLEATGRSPTLVADVRLQIALSQRDAEKLKLRLSNPAVMPSGASTLYAAILKNFDSPESVISILQNVFEDEGVDWPGKRQDIALFAAYFGNPDLAVEVMAEELRHIRIRTQLLWHPVMSEARKLSAFNALVHELNLVEYWRAYGWPDFCQPLNDFEFRCT